MEDKQDRRKFPARKRGKTVVVERKCEKMAEAVRSFGGSPFTTAQLIEKAGVSSFNVVTFLFGRVKNGSVKKLAHGLYQQIHNDIGPKKLPCGLVAELTWRVLYEATRSISVSEITYLVKVKGDISRDIRSSVGTLLTDWWRSKALERKPEEGAKRPVYLYKVKEGIIERPIATRVR